MTLCRGLSSYFAVMAGLVPAIHVSVRDRKIVDARVNPAHDE
jgi:hypothetical protein